MTGSWVVKLDLPTYPFLNDNQSVQINVKQNKIFSTFRFLVSPQNAIILNI